VGAAGIREFSRFSHLTKSAHHNVRGRGFLAGGVSSFARRRCHFHHPAADASPRPGPQAPTRDDPITDGNRIDEHLFPRGSSPLPSGSDIGGVVARVVDDLPRCFSSLVCRGEQKVAALI
jgi:hypothetical protein